MEVWPRWQARQATRLAMLETKGRPFRAPIEAVPSHKDRGRYLHIPGAPFVAGQPKPILLAWAWR